MEVFEAAGHSGSIEPGLVCGERLHVPEVGEELSSVDKFQNQV